MKKNKSCDLVIPCFVIPKYRLSVIFSEQTSAPPRQSKVRLTPLLFFLPPKNQRLFGEKEVLTEKARILTYLLHQNKNSIARWDFCFVLFIIN
jgi:hypothetical protein